jgi:hypothetical protein
MTVIAYEYSTPRQATADSLETPLDVVDMID